MISKERTLSLVTVTGFRHVFETKRFYEAPAGFLKQREKTNIETLIKEMEGKFAAGELEPSSLYNEIIKQERAERNRGYLFCTGGALVIGSISGIVMFEIADRITEVPATGVLGVVAAIVGTGVSAWEINKGQRTKAEALEKIERVLEKQYNVGTVEQLYPQVRGEKNRGAYSIRYKRGAEFNREAEVPVRFTEEHSLIGKEDRIIFKIIVENGVPKTLRWEKEGYEIQYTDFERRRGESEQFIPPLDLPQGVLAAYQERVERLVLFEYH